MAEPAPEFLPALPAVGLGARLLGFIRGLPPAVWIGLVAIAAVWMFGNHREAQGRADEKARWERRVEAAEAESAKLRLQWAQAAATAAALQVERDRLYQLARDPVTKEIVRYVQSPAAAAVCPDADGVRLGQAAINAANTATAAAR